ncbi:MFS transporter [Acidihalobacter yilgarnensis]|nr:MFS transporter [Acidihalobacter yilgarnensis]
MWRLTPVALMGGLGAGLVFPILPALGPQLGISGFMIGLILSANRITRLAFDAPAGHLIDRLGGRGPITFGLLIEGIGILCFSLALRVGPAAGWLLFGRAIFGIGSALLMVGIQATALGVSTRQDRGRKMASVRIAMSLGAPMGMALGGLLAERYSNDTAFLVGAASTFVAAAIAARLIPQVPHSVRVPASHEGLMTRLRALAALPAFPFMATAWGFNLLIFLSVQGVMLATLVLLVQARHIELFGLANQGSAGLAMGVMMGGASLAGLALGRIIDRLHLRSSLLIPALTGLAAGFMVLAFAHGTDMLLVGVLLIGGTFNGVSLPLLALLGDVTPPAAYGRAMGMYQIFGDIGGSLGPMVGIELFLRFGAETVYLALGMLILSSLSAAFWVRRREGVWCGRAG